MKKKKRQSLDALVLVLQFGINMIVPIAIMSLLGWWIGEKTGHNWVMIPFFFIGAIAGGNSIYRMSKSFFSSNRPTPGERAKEAAAKKAKKSSDKDINDKDIKK